MILTATIAVGVMLTADLQRRHETVLRTAITKAGLSMKEAAAEADLDKGQFTRQLQMLEGSFKRLAMQPVAFWQWYAVAIAKEFGLPQELDVAQQLELEMERAS